MLLSLHYQGTPLPVVLSKHLLETLRSIPAFAEWPLEDILPNREPFLRFLQEQWPQYLDVLQNKGDACLLPFDHQDVRAYVDTFFMEGLLEPVAYRCRGSVCNLDAESFRLVAQPAVRAAAGDGASCCSLFGERED